LDPRRRALPDNQSMAPEVALGGGAFACGVDQVVIE
jgi:hypothetical protein